MKRGFSLVGLLGIVVLCAVVFLLVYPRIVMIRTRNNVRDEMITYEAGKVIDAALNAYLDSITTKELITNGNVIDLTVDGTKPTAGTWRIDTSTNKVTIEGVVINGYTCNNSTGKIECTK